MLRFVSLGGAWCGGARLDMAKQGESPLGEARNPQGETIMSEPDLRRIAGALLGLADASRWRLLAKRGLVGPADAGLPPRELVRLALQRQAARRGRAGMLDLQAELEPPADATDVTDLAPELLGGDDEDDDGGDGGFSVDDEGVSL